MLESWFHVAEEDLVDEEMKVEEEKADQNGREEEEGVEPQICGPLPAALAVTP